MRAVSFCNKLLAGAFFLTSLSAAFGESLAPFNLPSVQKAYNLHQGFYLSGNILPLVAGGASMGYLFNNYIGLEVGVDSIWGWDFVGTMTATMYHLSVKSILPLGSRVELFGKLGVGVIHATEDNVEPFVNQHSESGGAAIGLGIGYAFARNWVASIEGNGMVYPTSPILTGGVGIIPSIGLTHYFS